MPSRSLLTSFAAAVTPGVQARREVALLEAGRLGEAHLHLSTLAGPVLGLGSFHLAPRAAGAGEPGAPLCWRRRTGGRVVAAGEGFVVLTLGLPHRAALVADEPAALRPEQVMNRCVRGILAWLRALGIDALYPGLDLVTVERRAIAHLSFAEAMDGPALFQAVLAIDASFAETARLLDAVDPEGRVPTSLIPSASLHDVAEGRAGIPASGPAALHELVAGISAGFREAFAVEVEVLDPGVTDLLLGEEPPDPAAIRRPPPDGATSAMQQGLLGPVCAWAVVAARDGIADCGLSGDFVAPDWIVAALEARLRGVAARRDAIRSTLDGLLDGTRGYLLGLKPVDLEDLLARAAGCA